MKEVMLVLAVSLLLCGCVSTGPAICKSRLGNLEINVTGAGQPDLSKAELYLDGVFVGNLTPRLPVIHAKNGQRCVRVTCSGYRPYEKKIPILGDPNHQVLNVVLEKE